MTSPTRRRDEPASPPRAGARPLLVFFFSPTCGRSRRAESFLAYVLQRASNHETFALRRVDATKRPDLAARFAVDELPAVCVVEGNRVVARIERPSGAKELARRLGPWLHGGERKRT